LALPPATPEEDVFIREVDEEYRRDRLNDLWKRYGRIGLLVLGVGLLIFAGILWWQQERVRSAGLLGEDYAQMLGKLERGDVEGAKPVLDKLVAEGNDGYRGIGLLTQAALAASEADAAKASALYAEVAADEGLPQPFRDLATLRLAALKFDEWTPKQVIEKVKPLAVEGGPWFPSAGEMLAIAYIRDGKPQLAGPLFAAIARDETAPTTLRGRASEMAASLGVDPAETPAKPTANTEAK
jgi:hypothetical protein